MTNDWGLRGTSLHLEVDGESEVRARVGSDSRHYQKLRVATACAFERFPNCRNFTLREAIANSNLNVAIGFGTALNGQSHLGAITPYLQLT